MANRAFRPAQTGYSRVFLIAGRARPDHKPLYQGAMKAGGLSWSFGDVEKIEIPSPDQFGQFIEVGSVRGATERATLTLTQRLASDLKSEVLKLVREGCPADVQIINGVCTDPTDYNTFTLKWILEDVRFTDYATEDLGALGSDEAAKVDESVDISIADAYQAVQVTFTEVAGDLVTNEVIDMVLCDNISCGDCEESSSGCDRVFAVTTSAGGSPGTPADVVFRAPNPATGVWQWYAHDVDSLLTTEAPTGITCLGQYVVVISSTSNSLHYALKSEHDGITDPTWAEVTTGFVTGGAPNAISQQLNGLAFIVGNGGYIYKTENPGDGATVLDAGVAHPAGTYRAVYALSEEFAVAVGNAGIIAKTENGETWAAVTPSPVGVGVNFLTVVVKSELEWWIGGSDGVLRYTLDGGETWRTKAFSGSGTGNVYSISQPTDSVMYLSHSTTAPRGRLFRSTNGGYDWVLLPEGSGVLPLADRFNKVVGCKHNVDRVYAGGLADNASDGSIVAGSD